MRKRHLQAEYEAGLARLGWRMPGFTLLLKSLYALPMTAASWLVWLFLPQLAELLTATGVSGINPNLFFSCVISALFVAIGFAVAFPRQVRRLLPAV